MTLGNMRQLGVQRLLATCLIDACRHHGLIDVSKYPDDTEVPWFASKIVCPTADDAAKIKAPVLAKYGELDTRITSGWPGFDAALTAAHVPPAYGGFSEIGMALKIKQFSESGVPPRHRRERSLGGTEARPLESAVELTWHNMRCGAPYRRRIRTGAGFLSPMPVTIITGFLGSGNTTLQNRLLSNPRLADTAVILNESRHEVVQP
jgi:hypothetical protein